MAWATGAETASVGPAVVVTALALLVGHVAGALAAAMPATADAEPALALRWWRPTAVIAGGHDGDRRDSSPLSTRGVPAGSLVVVLAALVVAGLGHVVVVGGRRGVSRRVTAGCAPPRGPGTAA